MKIKFKATEMMTTYDGSCADPDGTLHHLRFRDGCEHHVPNVKGAKLIRDYPDNFSAVEPAAKFDRPSGGEDKSAIPKPGTGEDKKGGMAS